MGDKPTNTDELISYLKKHPRVRYTNIVSMVFNQPRRFHSVSENGIRWAILDDQIRDNIALTPIYCQVAVGKLTFDEDSFAFTAFGVTSRFYYED